MLYAFLFRYCQIATISQHSAGNPEAEAKFIADNPDVADVGVDRLVQVMCEGVVAPDANAPLPKADKLLFAFDHAFSIKGQVSRSARLAFVCFVSHNSKGNDSHWNCFGRLR